MAAEPQRVALEIRDGCWQLPAAGTGLPRGRAPTNAQHLCTGGRAGRPAGRMETLKELDSACAA